MAATGGWERGRGIEGAAWTGGDGAAAVMAMAEWRSNKCVWSRLEAGYGGVETGVEWRWRPFDEKPGNSLVRVRIGAKKQQAARTGLELIGRAESALTVGKELWNKEIKPLLRVSDLYNADWCGGNIAL